MSKWISHTNEWLEYSVWRTYTSNGRADLHCLPSVIYLDIISLSSSLNVFLCLYTHSNIALCPIHFVYSNKVPFFIFSHQYIRLQYFYTLYILIIFQDKMNSLVCNSKPGSLEKNLPAKQETWIWSLGFEDPWRRKWQPTPVFQYCLGNPMDRGTWWPTVHSVAKELDTIQWLNNNKKNWVTDIVPWSLILTPPFLLLSRRFLNMFIFSFLHYSQTDFIQASNTANLYYFNWFKQCPIISLFFKACTKLIVS